MSGPSWGAGGPLVYGPVSTLAECLQHVAGCEDCRGRWPVVPGMLSMARRPDGHVEFDVTPSADGKPGPGPIRLLPREWFPNGIGIAASIPDGDSTSDPTVQDSRQDPTDPVPVYAQRIEFYTLVYDRRDHFWELRRLSGLRLDRGSELGGVCESLEDQLIDDLEFDPFTDEAEIGLIVTVRRRV